MREKRAFGELEMSILKLFKTDNKLTVKDVQEALSGQDKYTTIMTVMSRLVEKKQLTRVKIGLQYEYQRIPGTTSLTKNLLDKLKEKIFGGKSVSMISFLIESSEDITEVELAEMEKLIQEKKRENEK